METNTAIQVLPWPGLIRSNRRLVTGVLAIAAYVLLILGIFLFLSRTGLRIAERTAPLRETVLLTRYELTRFHLELDELLASKRAAGHERAFVHLDNARTHIRQMLDTDGFLLAGFSEERVDILRGFVEKSLLAVSELDALANATIEAHWSGADAQTLEQDVRQLDILFDRAQEQVETIEPQLKGMIATQLDRYRSSSDFMGAFVLVSALLVGWLLYFYERLRADDARRLEDSQSLLARAQGISHMGHWEMDIESGTVNWSDEVYQILGVAPHQFHGTFAEVMSYVYPEDRKRVEKAVAQAINGETDLKLDHRITRPWGDVRMVQQQGVVSIHPKTGEPWRMLGTIQDVTDRVKLQQELVSARDQLSSKLLEMEQINRELTSSKREIEGFYHTLSHELKTPLTSAQEFASIILDGLAGPVTEDQRRFLKRIKGGCDRMTVLINDLLDSTRIETGKLSYHPSPSRVEKMVEQAVDQVRSRAERAGVILTAETAEGLPKVMADPNRIVQVITNLLTNAVKFTPKGGAIELKAGFYKGDPHWVAIMVRDSGRGIEPHHLERIFERYHQSRKEDSDTHEGLGLGLYLCKELVTLHGGEISAYSKQGQGATFLFTLPSSKAEASEHTGTVLKPVAG